MAVNSEKESNWLYIWRKSQIGCPFGERAKLAVNAELKLVVLKFWHFLRSHPTGSLPEVCKSPIEENLLVVKTNK